MFTSRTNRAVGLVLLAMCLITLMLSWRASAKSTESNTHLRAYVSCQAEWTTFLYKAIATNRTANGEAQAAMDDLVSTVSEAKSEVDTRAALVRYKAAREAQIKAQQENPLPPPPKQVCQIKE